METEYKTFKKRWLVLAALVPIIIATEIYWLAFAPISSQVESFFGVSEISITLFAMSYMFMYILLAMPASWVVDKYGFKKSVAIGVVLMVIPAVLRYVFAEDFTVAIICQFAMAAAQPFIINISTKVPSNWFPVKERATASGLLVMAQYLGFIIPMAFSATLFGLGMKNMMGIFALITVIAGAAALILTRENPPVMPGPPEPKEDMNFRSIKALFKNRQYLIVLVIGFVSIGLLNTLLSMIESILEPKGMMLQAGIAGVVFLVAGVVGAVVVPIFSDKIRKRMVLLKTGMVVLLLLLAALTFFKLPILIMIVYGLMGFLVMGLAPILFQHGAEAAYPSKEGTSFGMVMLMGQVSGLIFVLAFEIISESSVLWSMLFLLIIALLQIPVALKMRESKVFLKETKKLE
ncbi:MAG: MFS transporter [Clostridia bacterium]|nr:MFS transporter [Clostridia bacterium]MBT7122171.1 MFS transporter [Clostridia bacterium]